LEDRIIYSIPVTLNY